MNIPKIQLTRDNLIEMRNRYYPRGSGPHQCLAVICGLIDAIAEDKGWELRSEETIRALKFKETYMGQQIDKILQKRFPGWHYDGFLCPGKAEHFTFRLVKGDREKIVHVNEHTHIITEEPEV